MLWFDAEELDQAESRRTGVPGVEELLCLTHP